MKAILIFDDTPENCGDCPCEYDSTLCRMEQKRLSFEAVFKRRPDWCPMKEVPEKMSMNHYDEHVPEDCKKLLEYYDAGFNACVDKILGTEDKS